MEIFDCRQQQQKNGAFASEMGRLWVLNLLQNHQFL